MPSIPPSCRETPRPRLTASATSSSASYAPVPAQAAHDLADFAEFLGQLEAEGFELAVIGGLAVGAYAQLIGEELLSVAYHRGPGEADPASEIIGGTDQAGRGWRKHKRLVDRSAT